MKNKKFKKLNCVPVKVFTLLLTFRIYRGHDGMSEIWFKTVPRVEYRQDWPLVDNIDTG